MCEISGTQNLNHVYDSNGNLTSDTGGRALAYIVFDKPNEITKGTHKTEFLYGPDRARYQRKDTQGTNIITTSYIGGVEKIHYSTTNTREWKRTVAGVARITRTFASTGATTNETHYLHYDHLGSISLITDDIGFAVEDFYFDPWGQSRKPADTVPTNNTGTWVLTTPFLKTGAPITSRGFTGHEMLDEVGLIHMNGRIYDAAIGRFVQADPLIQDPLRVQSLNRYSYVWNNPLNATDPSGFARGDSDEVVWRVVDRDKFEKWLEDNGISEDDFAKEMSDRGISEGSFGDQGVKVAGVAYDNGKYVFTSASGGSSDWNSVEYAKNIDFSKEPSGWWVNPDSDLPFVSEDGSDRCWMGSSPNCKEVLNETHGSSGVDWGEFYYQGMRSLEAFPGGGTASTGAKFVIAMSLLAKVDDVARGGKVAFGLTRHPFHGSANLLGRFAEKVGAKTYWDFFDNTSDLEKIMKPRLIQLMKNSDSIHFNLDGMTSLGYSLKDVAKFGREGIAQGNVTAWEFYQVLKNPDFFQKTTFYMNGKATSKVSQELLD